MYKNYAVLFILFLLASCMPEKPKLESDNTPNADSLSLALEEPKIEPKSKDRSDHFLQTGILFKEQRAKHIRELDSLENNKIVTTDSLKRFRQAITILDLADCHSVYVGIQVFVTIKNDSENLQGLYSFDGKELCKPIYKVIEPNMFEPLILLLDLKKTEGILMDTKGKIVLSGYVPFDSPDEKGDVLLLNEKNRKWGLYNLKSQKMLITPTFDSLGVFENGKALAVKNGERFYIDKMGKKTTPPNF